MFHISHQYKSPNVSSREGAAITVIVLHATVGSFASARSWLCSPSSGVSSHYLISKDCQILQLVSDDLRAHHAGVSAWQGVADVNDFSLSIELENNSTGSDPYPPPQLAALHWLVTKLLAEHHLTPQAIITHAQCALPANRKSDPAGFPLELFRASLTTPAPTGYTEDSPILGVTDVSPSRVFDALAARFPVRSNNPNLYTRADLRDILEEYWRVCVPVGVNPLLAVSQMLHETGYLVSFWSIREQRNPAGIGVTGKSSQVKPPNTDGWKFNTQRNQWEVGISFKNWKHHSIPAHVGRLLAYVLSPRTGTPEQRDLIARALLYRPLPLRTQGSAQTLKQLGKVHNPSGEGWASPGLDYGQRIATIANQFVEPA